MYLPRFALTRRRAVLSALALGVLAAAWPIYSRWQERESRNSVNPMQHYSLALRLLHPRSGLAPSTSDMKAAIHHLEVIPAGDSFGQWATQLLPLLRLKRDRPQDFPAAEEAKYRSCMAKAKAQEAEVQGQVARESPRRHLLTRDGRCVTVSCATGLSEACAPLATVECLSQFATFSPGPSVVEGAELSSNRVPTY
jgi:hypothetical protein